MAEAVETGKRFEGEMTVGRALSLDPRARWVLAAYHIGGCSHCAISDEETLADLAKGYGIELGKLLADLNSLRVDDPLTAT